MEEGEGRNFVLELSSLRLRPICRFQLPLRLSNSCETQAIPFSKTSHEATAVMIYILNEMLTFFAQNKL